MPDELQTIANTAVETAPPVTDTTIPPVGDAPPAAAPTGEAPKAGEAPPPAADWRKELAGDDEKAFKALERIPSQKELLKSWMEQKNLIASGKHKEPLGENATDEQKAEYRKANGIPETADDYYKTLPEGMVFGEQDKPGITKFLQDMHGVNAPPAMVTKALEAFVAAQEEGTLHRQEADNTARLDGIKALKTEWGADFQRNLNLMNEFTKIVPEADRANFLNTRMGDGTPMFSNPTMIKVFAQLGLANDSGQSTPNGGTQRMDVINEEIAAAEKRMSTDRTAWFKDTAAQAKYRDALDMRTKLTGKK